MRRNQGGKKRDESEKSKEEESSASIEEAESAEVEEDVPMKQHSATEKKGYKCRGIKKTLLEKLW